MYFENGSSYNSAAIWDISTKFGLLINCDLLNAVTSTDTRPEVVFSRRGRQLEKWIWRHISAVGASIWTKFGSLVQNTVQISSKWAAVRANEGSVRHSWCGRLSSSDSAGSSWLERRFRHGRLQHPVAETGHFVRAWWSSTGVAQVYVFRKRK